MKLTFIGHSHIRCFQLAYKANAIDPTIEVTFIQLRNKAFYKSDEGNSLFETINLTKLRNFLIRSIDPSSTVILCPTGNEHAVASMVNNAERKSTQVSDQLESLLANNVKWLKFLGKNVPAHTVAIPSPPPIESQAHIMAHPGTFAGRIAEHGISDSKTRLDAWLLQKARLEKTCVEIGVPFFDISSDCQTLTGFLRPEYAGNDPTHANVAYGKALLETIVMRLRDESSSKGRSSTIGARFKENSKQKTFGLGLLKRLISPLRNNSLANTQSPVEGSEPKKRSSHKHPYIGLPDHCFWKQSISAVAPGEVDPTGEASFQIKTSDSVATAGSCFAQHISKRIRSAGFHFLVTEKTTASGPTESNEQHFDFSARYGNIYTARQLKQLFDRCYGRFSPVDSAWKRSDGNYCDPFRPQIEASGFPTVEALEEDRKKHLLAVREMFETLDVFVFTLGLTECWLSKADDAAFPIAPGVAGGEFDEDKYRFENFGIDEVVSDLQIFLDDLRKVNPSARMIVTVSPVPLVATYEDQHVLTSTTYSKSVLRVAAEMLQRKNDGVVYFPSYEIIVGNFNRGAYFGPDLRSVTEAGVAHVMRLFMRRMTANIAAAGGDLGKIDEDLEEMVRLAEAACDEELLEKDTSG